MSDHFRSHFPVTAHWAFLDVAAVAPLPDVAQQAFADYATRLASHGIADIQHWGHRLRQVRSLAARLINAPAETDVCFVPSTTFGINLIAEGFPWQPGDNVVVPSEEFPSNIYPWMNQAARGVEVRLVPSRGPRVFLDDLIAAMSARTRVLAISAVEFASGYCNDLAALGESCRRRGVFFFVDAIQVLGMMPLDVQALGIDALAADSHKWLLGPEGAGLAYIRREWVDRLRPVMVGFNSVVNPWDFQQLDFTLKPHAGRYEAGANNIAGVHAMGASLSLLLEFGIDRAWSRIESLTDYLCEQSQRAGLSVFSSRKPGEKSGIVALAKPGADARALMQRCRAAGVIVNERRGRLRVSPHAFNNTADIDRFLNAIT